MVDFLLDEKLIFLNTIFMAMDLVILYFCYPHDYSDRVIQWETEGEEISVYVYLRVCISKRSKW